MARRSEDAAHMLAVLADQPLVRDTRMTLKGCRLGILDEHLTGPEMQSTVREAFDKAAEILRQEGAELRSVGIPHLDLAAAALLPIVGPEASAVHARWVEERPEDYSPGTREQLELGFAVPAVAYVRMQQFRRYLAGEFLKVLEEVDAILSPTSPWLAPEEDPSILEDEGLAEGRRTVQYNLIGFPAHSVPCGFSPQGLPIGLQIATRPYADTLALDIGKAFEAVSGTTGRIPPLVRALQQGSSLL
jgi:aspartyl-tRNA(Asn)/glutamyl-tRNA(Gln) amidotransferase subunit A